MLDKVSGTLRSAEEKAAEIGPCANTNCNPVLVLEIKEDN
jgi:hypothetical protein